MIVIMIIVVMIMLMLMMTTSKVGWMVRDSERRRGKEI